MNSSWSLPFAFVFPISDIFLWWNLGVAIFGIAFGLILGRYFRLKPRAVTMVALATLLGWLVAQAAAQVIPTHLGMPSVAQMADKAAEGDLEHFATWYEYFVAMGSYAAASFLGSGITVTPLGVILRSAAFHCRSSLR
jgi:hypothetical protein